MNILAIGPHPDDLEYGCGGTLARYAAGGHRVNMLVLTQGGEGGDASIRRREQETAAEILGIQELTFGEYPDTRIPLDKDFISFLEGMMEKTKPDIIFVHHGNDTHQDHRTVHT
ncbi:MAG: PIG-L family deacetylase, partial [bacterium]|nr:PIG-L family deacetylase [bacterium]